MRQNTPMRRLVDAKRGFATRRVPEQVLCGLEATESQLRAGDLVLATVTEIGQHQAIELPTGRRSMLNIGDEIVVACGARYAPDQFHAAQPEACGPANLVAAGGIAGIMLERHARMKEATRINILSRIVDAGGRPVNLVDHALPLIKEPAGIPIIAVAGTSMNAGKTTTCAAMIRGLAAAGHRPGYVKATGTGSGGDMWDLKDAGAAVTLDFTDAGYPSTYHAETSLLVDRALSLAAHAARNGASVVVMEIADGLLQQETAAVLTNDVFRRSISGVLFAAVDSMGAIAGQAWLEKAGHKVLGVSGAFTQAPLAIREFELATGVAPFKKRDIEQGALAPAVERASFAIAYAVAA